MDDVHLALYAEADFAGCVESLRSTSCGHLNIQGPNTRFPLSGSSKRQGCVSHSTPEAEIVAADVAMRATGMPALNLSCYSGFSRSHRTLCSMTTTRL